MEKLEEYENLEREKIERREEASTTQSIEMVTLNFVYLKSCELTQLHSDITSNYRQLCLIQTDVDP